MTLELAILSENLSVTKLYLDISFTLTVNSVLIGLIFEFLVGATLGFPKRG